MTTASLVGFIFGILTLVLDTIIRQAKFFYSASPKFQRAVKFICRSPFYYYLTRAKIKRQKEKDKKGPFNLVIETTNFCNAKCLMCPYSEMKRPKKIMKEKIFNKIITRIKEEKLPINKIFLSGMGEPLTDPNLINRIEALKKLGLPIRLYTNASLLTPKISQQLVDFGLDEINISFNGVTLEQYQKIMNLDFEKTVGNINFLIKIKRQKRSQKPFIQISSVVIKENERDIKKHIRNWSNKVDSVTVSRAHQWGGGIQVASKFNPPAGGQTSNIVYPCRSLWHTFNIDSQGNFVICCRDYESKRILGNILAHSFADVQKSPILRRFRQCNLKYSRRELPKTCQKCNFPYQEGIEWYLPRSID